VRARLMTIARHEARVNRVGVRHHCGWSYPP
jgi:hypothetical protein